MEQSNKRKSKFAILWVSEKPDGTIRQRAINSTAVELTTIALFILAVIAICQIVYKSILIEDVRKEMVDHLVIINNLTDENEALSADNLTLSNKVSVLSETVAKKIATEEVYAAEILENALPKGFPLSGSASIQESGVESLIVAFKATEGINVVTTGTGTVESIGLDEKYGTKIIINHGNGYKSIYYNNATALVKNGESLGKGYILFQVGKDNQELYYQIMKDEEYITPMAMIEISG